MNRSIKSTALAFAGVLLLALPTLAWHVETGKDEQTVRHTTPTASARIFDPAGDPYYRIIAKVSQSKTIIGPCTGWVQVPNQSWANGTTFYVTGTDVAIGKGERAHLPNGDYTGTWSNSQEVEHFSIHCNSVQVALDDQEAISLPIVWIGTGKAGPFRKVVWVPEGCTYRSSWRWLQGGNTTKVKSRGKVLASRATVTGTFHKLYAFPKGMSC